VIGPVEITPGQTAHLRFTATHDEFSDVPATFSYQITPYAGDTEAPNDLVSLNGLPAGSSIAATIVTPPGGNVSVDVDVNYTGDQPLTVDRLVALVDDDHDGVPEPVAETGLTTSLPSVVVSVPPGPTPGPAGDNPERSFVSLPNPFVPSSRIAFRVDGTGMVQVSLGVYDVNGRMVRLLYDDFFMKPGVHVVDWDGTDSHGVRLGAGMFFLRLEAGERTDAAKIVLIR